MRSRLVAAIDAGVVGLTSVSPARRHAEVPAADAGALSEVVVTAQRREESAQNVGIALSGRNPFNLSYDVTRNFFLPGTEVAQAGEPSTFGIRVSDKN